MKRLMIVFVCMLGASPLYAMRCGNDLVLKGDVDITVLERCGDPLYKTLLKVPCAGIEDGCTIMRWAFRKGKKHYDMVYISGGRVIKVETKAK